MSSTFSNLIHKRHSMFLMELKFIICFPNKQLLVDPHVFIFEAFHAVLHSDVNLC